MYESLSNTYHVAKDLHASEFNDSHVQSIRMSVKYGVLLGLHNLLIQFLFSERSPFSLALRLFPINSEVNCDLRTSRVFLSFVAYFTQMRSRVRLCLTHYRSLCPVQVLNFCQLWINECTSLSQIIPFSFHFCKSRPVKISTLHFISKCHPVI